MPRSNSVRRRALLAALVLISLVLLTVFFREPSTGVLHSVQRSSVGALSPLESLASKAVKPFQDGWRWVTTLWSAHDENQQLKSELEALRGQLVQLEEASQENERLKGLLDLKEANIFPSGSSFVSARVIGKSPTKWREWVLIDKGSADGVALNQPVVGATPSADQSLSGKGLVGKVIAVSSHSAQVQLLIDSESSVAAMVQGQDASTTGTRAQGIVEGTVSGKLIMDFVERDQIVELKQVVVTSGFGQIFPKGVPVGVVESVGEEDVNIYKQIEVQAFVDFRALEEVMVLTTPLPPAEDMEGLDPQQEIGLGGGFQ
jgi:rod shape-determining protein MreC